jgi:hypothetical protein
MQHGTDERAEGEPETWQCVCGARNLPTLAECYLCGDPRDAPSTPIGVENDPAGQRRSERWRGLTQGAALFILSLGLISLAQGRFNRPKPPPPSQEAIMRALQQQGITDFLKRNVGKKLPCGHLFAGGGMDEGGQYAECAEKPPHRFRNVNGVWTPMKG